MFSAAPEEVEYSILPTDQPCRRFSLHEIQSATQNFSEEFVVGRGGFGKVYKGKIDGSSSFVAIKRSNSMSNQGAPEFHAEVEMLSKLRHCNLVSLIGYCKERSEMVLVYEYMPHGTLADHLHRGGEPLSWLQRLKICIGAARGLDYLHTGTGTQHGIIHRDVKTSNILLDESFAAKISDFGLAKVGPTNQTVTYVSTGVKGTFGYMDPSYFYTGKLTRKSDVYSFGVVLLEVICGRPAVDASLDEAQWGLAPWAQEKIKQRKLSHIIDDRVRGQISNRCLNDIVQIASRCLHNQPNQRPTMADIVSKLQAILSFQERLNSSVTEGNFMDRVRIFFSSKVESKPNNLILVPAPTSGHEDEPSNKADGCEGEPSNKVDDSMDTSHGLPHNPQHPIFWNTFSYDVLKSATKNFNPDYMLGEGRQGVVYKGWINDLSLSAARPGTGIAVAIRRLDATLRSTELERKIAFIRQLNHPNLVKVIGYCLEDDHQFLVYEFMPGGSLEEHLFSRDPHKVPIPWNLRIKVIVDAAKGLAYIHNQRPQVALDHFKSSSILFDSNHNARICKILLAPQVSEGYIPTGLYTPHWPYAGPEFIYTGHISRKSQIYGFGMVLLELLTGMRHNDENRPYKERNLLYFAMPYLTSKRRISKIIDSRIHGQYSLDVAWRAAKLAVTCLSGEPSERPTADELVKELEELQELQKTTEEIKENES